MVIKKLQKLEQEYLNDPEARGYASMTVAAMYTDLTEKRYQEFAKYMLTETGIADELGATKCGAIMGLLADSADYTHQSIFRMLTKDGVNVNDEDFESFADLLVAAIPTVDANDKVTLLGLGYTMKCRATIIGYPNLAEINVQRVKEAN